MTKRAFSDPYYLQKDFVPDCNSPPPSLLGLTLPTSSSRPRRTTPHGRASKPTPYGRPKNEPSKEPFRGPTGQNTPTPKSAATNQINSAYTINSFYTNFVTLIVCFFVSR